MPIQNSPAPLLIERDALSDLFRAIRARGYEIVGPTIREGAIVYDHLKDTDALPIGWTDRSDFVGAQLPGERTARRRPRLYRHGNGGIRADRRTLRRADRRHRFRAPGRPAGRLPVRSATRTRLGARREPVQPFGADGRQPRGAQDYWRSVRSGAAEMARHRRDQLKRPRPFVSNMRTSMPNCDLAWPR